MMSDDPIDAEWAQEQATARGHIERLHARAALITDQAIAELPRLLRRPVGWIFRWWVNR